MILFYKSVVLFAETLDETAPNHIITGPTTTQ